MIKGFVQNNFEIEIVTRDDKNFDITDKNIILAVKPYNIDEVAQNIKGKAKLLISILAGTKLDSLKNAISSQYYVRAMPNLSSAYLKSMTTLTGDKELKNIVNPIMSSIGKILWLNSEKELDIATSIAGSGPAFLAIVAEALADGGVNCGLKRDDAQTIVNGLFYGFNDILENYKSPAIIKDDVMSPAGTTSAGVFTLEENGIRTAFIKAIDNATKRAKSIANS